MRDVKGKDINEEYWLSIEGHCGRSEVPSHFDWWLGDSGGAGEIGIILI